VDGGAAGMIPRRLRTREPLITHVIAVEQHMTTDQLDQLRREWLANMGARRRVVIVAGIGRSGSVREVTR